jgi:hypothetical protein
MHRTEPPVKRTRRKEVSDLEWAVSFALRDLDAIRPGDWLNLRDELTRFMGFREGQPSTLGYVALSRPIPAQASEDYIRELHAETTEMLDMVLALRDAGGPTTTTTRKRDLRETTVRWSAFALRSGGPVVLQAMGDLKSLFRLRLLFLFAQEGANRLVRCPVCQRPFWKAGRKKYCSRACTNKAVFGAWLKSDKGRTRSTRAAKQARENRAYKRRLAERRSARPAGGEA